MHPSDGLQGRLLNIPAGVPPTYTCTHSHMYVHTCTHNTHMYTHTPSHTLSSPGARCLTFIQEACHIVGIFKKELKESTEQFDLCPGLLRDEEQDCLSFPLSSEGRAHECWAQSDSRVSAWCPSQEGNMKLLPAQNKLPTPERGAGDGGFLFLKKTA